jgi:integrase
VLGLCLSDIDFATGKVTLQHKLVWVRPQRNAQGKRVSDANGNPVPGHFEVKDTLKTEESSDVFTLEPQELALLKARKKQQAAEQLKAERWIGNPWGLLFTTDSGQPCHARDLERPFKRFLKASGFQGRARLYDLRHGGISHVAATFGLKEAQAFARHKQFSTTADVYAHVADRRKREVGRAMGSLVLSS